MDTGELIKKCVAKNPEAWREFIERYEDIVARSVRNKLSKLGAKFPRDEFHDIVQEIFLMIWENNRLAGLRDIRVLKNWLIMVALNKTSNYCRRRANTKPPGTVSFDEHVNSEGMLVSPESVIPNGEPDAGDIFESRELRAVVKKATDSLDHRQQLAFKLYVYERLRLKDIAAIMNIPANTAATLVRRARIEVRKKIDKYSERNTRE